MGEDNHMYEIPKSLLGFKGLLYVWLLRLPLIGFGLLVFFGSPPSIGSVMIICFLVLSILGVLLSIHINDLRLGRPYRSPGGYGPFRGPYANRNRKPTLPE